MRDSVPLEAHAEIPTDPERIAPLATLARQDRLRLDSLVPLRYGRMSRTPITFLRGAAAVMASDLATMPTTDLMVELCGDAHLGNFRWFMAPDRRLVFDLSDFDETLPGPFEWDLKRLAASVVVAARNNAFKRKECRAIARATVQTYVKTIGQASELNPLELFYTRLESDEVLTSIRRFGKKARQVEEERPGQGDAQEQPAGLQEAHGCGRGQTGHRARSPAGRTHGGRAGWGALARGLS